jgi:hypothetical protein
MTPLLENAALNSDLNGNFYDILNVTIIPLPANLAVTTDPRLSDARAPLPGSVTDASVAAGAAILQSKLALTGVIPPTWLGTTATTAAKGSLAEYLINKGAPNGYAPLDATGKVPSVLLPATVGTGTVTSVALTMPAQFSVTGTPVVGAGTLAVAWASVADLSWFGNKAGAPGPPQFYSTPLPAALIPPLDASIVTSGVFSPALLPVAVGLGVSHAQGAVPDPGAGGGGALSTDYLARDMSYKPAPSLGATYQPTIPNPSLGISANLTGPLSVTATSTIPGAVFFYSLASGISAFAEFPPAGYISLASGASVWVYAAHPGYNNSNVVTITNSNPP